MDDSFLKDTFSKTSDLLLRHCGSSLPMAPMLRLLKSEATNLILSKEAKSEISASHNLFLLFMATLARDSAEANKRKVLNANDVLSALKSSRIFDTGDENDDIIDKLNVAVQEFRQRRKQQSLKRGATTIETEEVKERLVISNDEMDCD